MEFFIFVLSFRKRTSKLVRKRTDILHDHLKFLKSTTEINLKVVTGELKIMKSI